MAVTLTPAAAEHITAFLAKRGKGMGLRLGVRTTGCPSIPRHSPRHWSAVTKSTLPRMRSGSI